MAAQEKLETSSDHRGESGEILSLLKKTGKRSRSSISTPKRPSNNSPQNATIESSSADNSNSRKSQPAVVKQANKKPQKPRRRVATMAQRRAANIRERRRMFNLNSAFDRLRKKVPSFAYEKRLSRIETLKLAIMYIRFMDDLVNDDAYAEKYKQLTSNVSASNINSGSYLSLYGHCESLSPIPVQNQQQQQSLSAIQGPPNQATPNQASHPVFACKQVSATHSNYMIGHEPVALELVDQGPSAIKFGSKIHQHNVLGARRSSPSGSLACCSSSPASSPTLNTCHSSSTTFSESPSASPMVQLHSRASPLSAHLHHQQQHHSYYARQQSYPISVDLEQNSKLHYYEVGHSKDAYCRASHDAGYACDVSAYSRAHSGPHQSSPYEHPMNQIHQPAAQSQHTGGPKQVEHQTIQATY